MADTPFVKANQKMAELSLRVILLAILLTLLLATSNAYLALKLGILTSASIPAAILSMGILRLFKNPSILENNAVQTAASAGEAVAGGIVYTIPTLILIGYWNHFDYWVNFSIAACGGILGVLFSIPLRRILVHDPLLKFPEGRAIAEVLKSSAEKVEIKDIVIGSAIGAFLELLQTGFQLIANSWNYWFVVKRSLFTLGVGFSATMIGAGYLVGYDMALSIFFGALIAYGIALPITSQFYPEFGYLYPPEQAASLLWGNQMRYLGIGAMLFAGIWTFLKLVKPLFNNMSTSLFSFLSMKKEYSRTDKDLPMSFILGGVGLMTLLLFFFFQGLFPLEKVGLSPHFSLILLFVSVFYVLFVGFLFSVITAYFSGMVGVTASPGSSVIISGMLFAAWLLMTALHSLLPSPLDTEQMRAAEAIAIIIGSVVTGIAAIANDNTQDLKVGQLVGATPWKQQVMLLLGVLISSLVIPPVMQLLFNVYGIAGIVPRPEMDTSLTLAAPTAALMAAITQAVFSHSLPWTMMLAGSSIIALILLINQLLKRKTTFHLSILGVAIGMYLPLTTSFPLFLGGMIAWFVQKRLARMKTSSEENLSRKQQGTLIACGLVAGSAIMDVLLAIPFSIAHNPDVLRLVSTGWEKPGLYLGILSVLMLAWWFKKRVCD